MSTTPVLPPPHAPVSGTIASLVKGASQVKFAIAYFTRSAAHSVDPIISAVERLDQSFGIVSVEWPTDIDELVELQKRIPGKLYIHLGAWPKSGKKDIGKLHCKVVYVESAEYARIQIGSHNWTKAALDGSNIELAVRHEVQRSDPLAGATSQFLDDVRALAEPFDPLKTDFYREIQRSMAPNPPAHAVTPELGFQETELTVAHVNITADAPLAAGDRVYLELDSARDPLFPKDRQVHLYARDSQGRSKLLLGVVTNQNNTQFRTANADTFRQYPECTSMIVGWNPPVLKKMEIPLTGNRSPQAQGVLLISGPPPGVGYFYHLGSQRPRTSYDVIKRPILGTIPAEVLARAAPSIIDRGFLVPVGVSVTTVPRFDRRSTGSNREEGYPVALLSRELSRGSQSVQVSVEPSYEDPGETFETQFMASTVSPEPHSRSPLEEDKMTENRELE